MIEIVGAREGVVGMSGRAATLNEPKAAFKRKLRGWQDWQATGMRHHKITAAVSGQFSYAGGMG